MLNTIPTPNNKKEKNIDIELEAAPSPVDRPNGMAVAAYISAMFGILVMSVVNLFTDISDPFKELVHNIGKLWMPGAEGIGPYSGKETLGYGAWIVAWVILHFLLRKKNLNETTPLVIFILGIGAATVLFWPPVFNGIAHMLGK